MRNDLHFFPTPRRVVHVIKIHFFPPILSLNEMKKQGGMHRVGRMYKSRRRIDPPTGVAEGGKCGSFSSSTDRHAMNDDSRVMADQTPTKQLFFFSFEKIFSSSKNHVPPDKEKRCCACDHTNRPPQLLIEATACWFAVRSTEGSLCPVRLVGWRIFIANRRHETTSFRRPNVHQRPLARGGRISSKVGRGGKNAATKRHFVSCPLDKVHLVAAENDLSRQAARRRRLPLREQLLNHSAAV